MSVDPKTWGPCAWWTLHTCAAKTAASGKREDLSIFWDMMQGMQCLLPCETCREHMRVHLALLKRPRSAAAVPGWVYRLHNAVNDTIDGAASAPSRDADYRPTRRAITELYAKPCNVHAMQADLVTKAAPFLAAITPQPDDADCVASMAAFVRGLSHFFGIEKAAPAGVCKSGTAFKRWLGVKRVHVINCSGTCTQKGGC